MKKNPLELPQPIQEALVLFEIFRRLGFPASNIYFVAAANSGAIQVREGKLAFTAVFTPHELNEQELIAEWQIASNNLINENFDPDGYRKMYYGSKSVKYALVIVKGMLERGMLPRLANMAPVGNA